MTVFWSLATTLSLLALAFVLPPLLRRDRGTTGANPDELNTEVTRERLSELESDLQSGRLNQDQYDAAREDLERELLYDLGTAAGNTTPGTPRSGRWVAVIIAIALPVCATLLYKSLGSEPIIALLQQQPPAGQAQTASSRQMSVDEMVSRLATRLQNDPDNLQGWDMLSKSYTVLERYDLAVPAYRNVMRLGGGKDPDTLADFADALAATANGVFPEEAGKLLTDALQLDPDNIKALWLAGHWKNQTGDTSAALAYWEHASSLMPQNSADNRTIRQQISQIRKQAGLPDQEPAAMAAAAQPVAGGAASLQVTVTLDPALRDKADADSTVFIYARAASGPPMPLAIVRKQVRDLPVTVTLDDSMAMAPGMVMSRFPELTVGARVSKSGNAMPQDGDLQGLQTAVHTADTHSLDIVINSVVGAQAAVPATTAAKPSAGAAASLQVKVSLDPGLRDKADADSTVFIYARAASGPPMPLAIVRKQVRDLPVTVTLDDSMAMAPGMVMSRFPELTVGARVSKSGNAMPRSGDLQTTKTPVRPADTKTLDLVIDSTVP
jgi:cytochrome c-type biogenesis protein CcmH